MFGWFKRRKEAKLAAKKAEEEKLMGEEAAREAARKAEAVSDKTKVVKMPSNEKPPAPENKEPEADKK